MGPAWDLFRFCEKFSVGCFLRAQFVTDFRISSNPLLRGCGIRGEARSIQKLRPWGLDCMVFVLSVELDLEF